MKKIHGEQNELILTEFRNVDDAMFSIKPLNMVVAADANILLDGNNVKSLNVTRLTFNNSTEKVLYSSVKVMISYEVVIGSFGDDMVAMLPFWMLWRLQCTNTTPMMIVPLIIKSFRTIKVKNVKDVKNVYWGELDCEKKIVFSIFNCDFYCFKYYNNKFCG